MSYEIIYNRQFIKVDDNRVIPFLEMGSNNCYEATGSGRKRARSWGNSYGFTNGCIIAYNDELLYNIDNYEKEIIERSKKNVEEYGDSWAYDPKRFGYHTGISFYGRGTRSTTFSAFRSYYKNGIKTAKTIEELKEHGVQFYLTVYRWKDEDILSKGLEIKPDVTFESTEQMINTINEYEEYYGGKVSLYINLLGSDWNLVQMIKDKNREKRMNRKTKEKTLTNEYFTLVSKNNGGYFVRFTARGYRYSYFQSSGKKFLTEKQAEKFKSKMRNGDLFTIEKINSYNEVYV